MSSDWQAALVKLLESHFAPMLKEGEGLHTSIHLERESLMKSGVSFLRGLKSADLLFLLHAHILGSSTLAFSSEVHLLSSHFTTTDQQPQRQHLNRTTSSRSTGVEQESGSEDKTPGAEMTLCHVVNLTRFTQLIMAPMRPRCWLWQAGVLKAAFSCRHTLKQLLWKIRLALRRCVAMFLIPRLQAVGRSVA